jgi:hypothetical protein
MNSDTIKSQVLNELKPIMLEAVEKWLNAQRDTLLLSLVGMIENEKWKREHSEQDDLVEKAMDELVPEDGDATPISISHHTH